MNTIRKKFTDVVVASAPYTAAVAAVAAGLHPNPTYNAIWVAVSTCLSMMPANERKVFAKEFNKSAISEEILSSVEFIRAAKVAMEAAANTASEDKIKKIAQLLRNASVGGLIQEYDVFKEYIKLIDDISPQEFYILALMKHSMEKSEFFETLRSLAAHKVTEKMSKPRETIDELETLNEAQEKIMWALEPYWEDAKAQIKLSLSTTDEAVENYMLRLTRTGCVAPFTIQTMGGDRTIYRITSLYLSLENYINRSQ